MSEQPVSQGGRVFEPMPEPGAIDASCRTMLSLDGLTLLVGTEKVRSS